MNEPTSTSRAIELEVDVPGTVEEVWRAIATGPGISSWYVPHVVEERAGGAALASFGDAPEMQIPGKVVAWDPPRRVVFTAAEDSDFAFEWLVEARDGGSCVVRLVNSGFGEGGDWDGQYDAMTEGWQLFLFNLQLHCRHFLGQQAVSMLPMAQTSMAKDDAWAKVRGNLGLVSTAAVGDRVSLEAEADLGLTGSVVRTTATGIALLLEAPAPGTAFVAVEGGDEGGTISAWTYLYGPDGPAIVERDKPRWQAWLTAVAG
ncbi:MAG: SRPBCC domain-containing protein [Actinomycetota bacterium]|nr:SRPBCC domain-containing protein [Actinomycetota bacterium]